jgi:hypothetical protein
MTLNVTVNQPRRAGDRTPSRLLMAAFETWAVGPGRMGYCRSTTARCPGNRHGAGVAFVVSGPKRPNCEGRPLTVDFLVWEKATES